MTGIRSVSSGNYITRVLLLFGLFLTVSCQSPVSENEHQPIDGNIETQNALSSSQIRTLNSLEQIDDYPLYTMAYEGDYNSARLGSFDLPEKKEEPAWACSLFAVFGNQDDTLFGRNFDWDFSPAMLLYTDPPDGYKSVSMVDLYYLGFEDERAFGIGELPLEEKLSLLDAPLLPFDGMNEAGLMVGMAAVPDGGMEIDPAKETVGSLMAIRMILDQAATIDEAVEIISNVNIDMRGNYLHYLISEESGRSALVEFSDGEIIVHYNTEDWQPATNFILAEEDGDNHNKCWRYDLISHTLEEAEGKLSAQEAMTLLERVAQEHTQWSVVYRGTAREIWVVMGSNFEEIYQFDFDK